ncbi:MAG: heparinase II/III-family protein [Clostridia bacterium]|nr:heparinase II/III-family protein [Clostridia bacterium]
MQGLTPVAYLVGAFALQQKKEYMDLALKFFYEWNDFSDNEEKNFVNEYIWDEHAAAIRAESILYLFLVCNENNISIKRSIFEDSIRQHAEWLTLDEHYLKGTNHGVYENKALLYIGYASDNKKYINIAKARTYQEIENLFTKEYISTENSFNYHRINKELFLEIGIVLQNQGDKLGDELFELARKAEDFMGYAIKPDGSCAVFGDTLWADYTNCKCIDKNGVLAYATNQGKMWDENSKEVPEKIIVYPKSGYFICREFWNCTAKTKLGFTDATWLLFKSGYNNIVHKQADDNSFALYSRGYDIFVDCGMYNYMFRDPIRQYVRSANAHNTVIADEKSFEFLRKDLTERCGIMHSEIQSDFGYVVGYNYLYHGIYMVRHFVFSNNKVFILDQIESNFEHKYSQLFHLGKNMNVSYLSDSRLIANIGDTNYTVTLTQLESQDCTMELINGGAGCQGHAELNYGIMSEEFNSFFPIDTIKYNSIKSNYEFATSITINEKGESNCDSFSYNKSKGVLTIVDQNEARELQLLSKKKIAEKSPPKLFFDNFNIALQDSRILITDNENYDEEYTYAWYLIDEATRKNVYIQMYKPENTFSYDLDSLNISQCSIRAFMLNKKQDKKRSQVLAHFLKDKKGRWSYIRELNIDESLIK